MVRVGDRVEVTGLMPDDPAPLPVGLRGTVTNVVRQFDQIWVDWDKDEQGHSRSLILLMSDPYRIVRDE